MRTLRGRLTAAASLVALVAIAVLTIAFNIVLDRSRDADITRPTSPCSGHSPSPVSSSPGRPRSPGSSSAEPSPRSGR
ncbi:MAG: hypothetical protein LC720_06550 [Actinobacteria bacterium]|nr:hypothetical protein [Actinomycetota bacterium]